MIEIELIGGPFDGTEMCVEKHRYECIFTKKYASPLYMVNLDDVETHRIYACLYRKVPGADKYRFVEVRQR